LINHAFTQESLANAR